jgi:hypothetical protein
MSEHSEKEARRVSDKITVLFNAFVALRGAEGWVLVEGLRFYEDWQVKDYAAGLVQSGFVQSGWHKVGEALRPQRYSIHLVEDPQLRIIGKLSSTQTPITARLEHRDGDETWSVYDADTAPLLWFARLFYYTE